MVKLTHDQLLDIIEKHKYYLKNRIENIDYKANLRSADLSDVDLRGANLSDADLRGADLRGANLSDANLSDANLRGADLGGADLRGADLSDANLSDANLRGVNLRGADLSDANLRGVEAYQVPPSDGSFIGWKKVENNLIVKLMILEDAKRSSAFGRKCRCDKALVLDIQKLNGESANTTVATSGYQKDFKYEINKIVQVEDFNENRFEECAPGIHFFITRDEAVDY